MNSKEENPLIEEENISIEEEILNNDSESESFSMFESYIPERRYFNRKQYGTVRGYLPIGPTKPSICESCVFYYKTLHEKGLKNTPDTPLCNGHAARLLKDVPTGSFSKDELELMSLMIDPVVWCKAELNWEPFFYQSEYISCTSYKKILRTGRQLGKTTCVAADILHKCFTKKDFKVLVLTPFGPAIEEIFTIIREHIDNSNNLRNSIISDIKNPQTIKFANGSRIVGYPITPGDTKAVNKIRGQRANMVYIDEADFIDPGHMQVILPIANKLDTYVTMTSTPKGTKTIWTNLITNKNSGYKEFWYALPERPDWTPDFSAQQSVFGQAGYTREYDAEITASAKGVFRKDLVDSSIQFYNMENITPLNSGSTVKILGIDWNKGAGAHIVLVGRYEGKFKLLKKWIINPEEFKQTEAVNKVIAINNEWSPEFIYIDEGYGDVQHEMLIKFGLQNPTSRLHTKVKKINMSQKIEIKNPKDGSIEKKWAKGFMFLNMAKLLQDNLLILPQSEDTNSVLDDSVASSIGIIQQMREVELKKSSSIARAQFIAPVDHTITAYGLALLGFTLNYSNYIKHDYGSAIFIAAEYKPMTKFAKSKSKDLKNIDRSLADKKIDKKRNIPTLEKIDDLSIEGIVINRKPNNFSQKNSFGRDRKKDNDNFRRNSF